MQEQWGKTRRPACADGGRNGPGGRGGRRVQDRQAARLNRRITNSRITAPITATMIEPMKPLPMLMPSRPTSQPAADDGADDADDDVDQQTESAALDEQPGEPAGNRADDEPHNQAMSHGGLLLVKFFK